MYFDYLDFHILGDTKDLNNEIRVKFDFLAFFPDIFCLTVPACIKLAPTTELLVKLTPFWINGNLKIILDKKHKKNPFSYFDSRRKKLERHLRDELLEKHFEYTAYSSNRPQIFFNSYLASIQDSDIYLPKISDTDADYRQRVKLIIDSKADDICKVLPVQERIRMDGAFASLFSYANDETVLFQRSIVDEHLQEEHNLLNFETNILRNMLDSGFAYANAISSDAVPISRIQNQITGKYIAELLRQCDPPLFDLLVSLDFEQVFVLCTDTTWNEFIDVLNMIVLLYQQKQLHENTLPPIHSLTLHENTISLVCLLADKFSSSFSSLLIDHGLFAERQHLLNQIKLLSTYTDSVNAYLSYIKKLDSLLPDLYSTVNRISQNHRISGRTLQQKKGFLFD